MTALKVPYDQLSPEALQGVIEEFVTRDGTDYGELIAMQEKAAKARLHSFWLIAEVYQLMNDFFQLHPS